MTTAKTGFTVAQLIEWLRTQDQDAIVQVVDHTLSGADYCEQGGTARVVDFVPNKEEGLFEYTDFRGNKFVSRDEAHFEKRYLLLGIHNG